MVVVDVVVVDVVDVVLAVVDVLVVDVGPVEVVLVLVVVVDALVGFDVVAAASPLSVPGVKRGSLGSLATEPLTSVTGAVSVAPSAAPQAASTAIVRTADSDRTNTPRT